MIAGVFVYVAPHFARSIECVRLGLCERLHDNEAIKVVDFENLGRIIATLNEPGLFEPSHIADITEAICRLLEQEGYLVFVPETGDLSLIHI